jgi:hypothetical protein
MDRGLWPVSLQIRKRFDAIFPRFHVPPCHLLHPNAQASHQSVPRLQLHHGSRLQFPQEFAPQDGHKAGLGEPFALQIPAPFIPGQPLEVEIALPEREMPIKTGPERTPLPMKVHAYLGPPFISKRFLRGRMSFSVLWNRAERFK